MENGMDNKRRDGWKKDEQRVRTAGWVLLTVQLTLPAAFALMLLGCTTTRYVPVEKVRTEYRNRVVMRHDTVRDSVLRHDYVWRHDSMDVKKTGDTIRVDRWHTVQVVRYVREKGERMSAKADSASAVRTDSIYVPVPVEKKVTRWEKMRKDVYSFAVTAVAVVTLMVVGSGYWKRNK